MERTIPTQWLEKNVDGYLLNAGFSSKNSGVLESFQRELKESFPDVIWCTPVGGLHITLFDWLAPLVDYGMDKKRLFDEYFESYDAVLTEILNDIGPIPIEFSELRVTPNAIITVGVDNGSFQEIRDKFISRIDLIPGTKPPPKIIHATLCRYQKEIDLALIKNIAGTKRVNLKEEVREFRLLHEIIAPMVEFELVKKYRLSHGTIEKET
ncbi:hypothetical protein C4552_00390 [Candidatus Parcubacteria bacterium]|nr:MAG: hypothetical protein C4552_00390 [Candidatus Parcubacteria bacterium]